MVLRAYLHLSQDSDTLTVPRGPADWKHISTLGLGKAGEATREGPCVTWIREGRAPSSGGVRMSKIVSQFSPLMRRIGFVPFRHSLADLMDLADEAVREQRRT
jgi:hypothetical protein